MKKFHPNGGYNRIRTVSYSCYLPTLCGLEKLLLSANLFGLFPFRFIDFLGMGVFISQNDSMFSSS